MKVRDARFLRSLVVLLAVAGCAHVYRYEPQVAFDGSRVWRGGVVYPIPRGEKPEFQLKIESLGIVPAPPRMGANPVPMLLVRLFFLRATAYEKNSEVAEFINPAELIVRYASGQTAKPGLVHASTKLQPLIELNANQKQAVELFYDLPPEFRDSDSLRSFGFEWRVHYGNEKVAEQVVVFDRVDIHADTMPQQTPRPGSLGADDPFNFYHASAVIPPDWTGNDWFWWDPFHKEGRTFWP